MPLAAALQAVRERIAAACGRAGREPSAVRLVAVSKSMAADRVRELFELGQELFGENRVQEALPKIEAVGGAARWHLVGALQRNKARHAVGAFELIHSVDGAALANELDRRARVTGLVQRVLVQVNLVQEATKSGVGPEELGPLLDVIAGLDRLELCGLMTIPPPVARAEESRPHFARLRGLAEEAGRRLGRALPELSMGMSDDFEVAVEEGATLVRVGRALFGERS